MFRRSKATDAVGRLSEVAFFQGFTTEELERVAELAQDVEADPEDVLTGQDRPGLECYVIEVGQANLYFAGEHVSTLGPGSMVGEMALINHRPRSATVLAETPMRLIAFDAEHFKQLLDEMPKACERVTALLEARLRADAARQAKS